MNCIEPGDLQKYIDGEASPEEMASMENHLALCDKCARRLGQQRKIASGIRQALNLLAKDPGAVPGSVEAPEFAGIPDLATARGRSSMPRITGKRMLYAITAACVGVLVWFLAHHDKPGSGDEIIYTMSLEWEYDANRTVSQQPLVIERIDPAGKLTGIQGSNK